MNTMSIHMLKEKKEDRQDESSFDFEALYATLTQTYSHASTLYKMGNYKAAEKVFAELIELNPLSAVYWFGLGASLQKQRDYSEAIPCWNMSALLDGDNPSPCFHAAECYFSEGITDKGLELLQIAEERAKEKEDKRLEEKINVLKSQWDEKRRSN